RPAGPWRKFLRRVRANPVATGGIAAFILAVGVMVALLVRPRLEPAAPVIIQPPPPVGTEGERAWREKFEPFQAELAFHNFRSFPDERAGEAKRLLAAIPPSLEVDVGNWFLGQGTQVPFDVWARSDWWDRREEARRRVDWCRAILAVLEGKSGKFAEAKNLASDRAARYAPVAAYRGSVTLRIMATPFAEVRSLRAGNTWIVKDGKLTAGKPGTPVEYTPFVAENLDIADYELVLVDPKGVERKLPIPGAGMKHSSRYTFTGSLSQPQSFALREDR
ncbi:MAG TPA: hypothetical protein VFC86_06395, partial [Planctomycetota bacterium]|nr:hypothetical protein [Planctomycetota bacterium]